MEFGQNGGVFGGTRVPVLGLFRLFVGGSVVHDESLRQEGGVGIFFFFSLFSPFFLFFFFSFSFFSVTLFFFF